MNPARPLIEAVGLGPAYYDAWWRVAATRRKLITDWSRQHGALFIHAPKTAGMSVYVGLDMERPPDTHAPAAALRIADRDTYDAVFRFTVARNPWDRLVSAYAYLSGGSAYPQDRIWAARHLADVPDFASFLQAMRRPYRRNRILAWRHFLPQTLFLTVGGEISTHQIIPFCDLDDGLSDVARRIGATYRPTHINRSRRTDYRRYYDDDGAALVQKLYADDIRLTGASFDKP